MEKDKKVHAFLARSDDCDIDMRDLVPMVAEQINGKGGGRPTFVEIAGDNPQNLSTALDKARVILFERTPRPTID